MASDDRDAAAAAGDEDPLIGRVLADRYEIDRRLGEGGMGAVYLARHTHLDKPVAIKVLHGEFSRKRDLVERFLQEAKAASKIKHENVIDITDFGSTPDQYVFFVMELLDGRDLHDELTRTKLDGDVLPWERSKSIFLQICAALEAAHDKGIIHRDLKPENIYLVKWYGQDDFVKLLDFGIAKMTEVSEDGRRLTKTGMLFGTPEYMSPEQARGEKADHRVDVYAMGCILFQMLSGSVPFDAENFMGILTKHLAEEVPPLTSDVLERSGAPSAVRGVVMKALAKNRDERFSSIRELSDAIRALGTAAPEPAARMPTGGRKKTNWTGSVKLPEYDDSEDRAASKSNAALWIGGAVVVAAIIGGAAFMATRGGGEQAAAQPADAAVTAPTDAAAPTRTQPTEITVVVKTTPPGAEVRDVDGKVLGKTPYETTVPPDTEPEVVELHLDGYVPERFKLSFDGDATYKRKLTKARGSTRNMKPREVKVSRETKSEGTADKPKETRGTADKPKETKGTTDKPKETEGTADKPKGTPIKKCNPKINPDCDRLKTDFPPE